MTPTKNRQQNTPDVEPFVNVPVKYCERESTLTEECLTIGQRESNQNGRIKIWINERSIKQSSQRHILPSKLDPC